MDNDSGLNDLLAKAVERNIAHVEQKTGALDRYLDVSSHYVKQLRYVTEVAKVSVDRWEAHVKELMDRSAPPIPLQEAISPPEHVPGRRQAISRLADMLAEARAVMT